MNDQQHAIAGLRRQCNHIEDDIEAFVVAAELAELWKDRVAVDAMDCLIASCRTALVACRARLHVLDPVSDADIAAMLPTT